MPKVWLQGQFSCHEWRSMSMSRNIGMDVKYATGRTVSLTSSKIAARSQKLSLASDVKCAAWTWYIYLPEAIYSWCISWYISCPSASSSCSTVHLNRCERKVHAKIIKKIVEHEHHTSQLRYQLATSQSNLPTTLSGYCADIANFSVEYPPRIWAVMHLTPSPWQRHESA